MRVDLRACMRQLRYNRILKQYYWTSGTHYYEVFVVATSACSNLVLGVVNAACHGDHHSFVEGETLRSPRANWLHGAIGYCANGAIVKDGVEIARVCPYQQGDSVGILIDMNVKRITFYLNGQEQVINQKEQFVANDHGIAFSHHAVFVAMTFAPRLDHVELYFSSHLPIK